MDRIFRARIAAPTGDRSGVWPWGRILLVEGGGVIVPELALVGVGSLSTIGESGSRMDGGVPGSWKAVVTPAGMCKLGRAPGAPDVFKDCRAGFLRAILDVLNCRWASGGRCSIVLVLRTCVWRVVV